ATTSPSSTCQPWWWSISSSSPICSARFPDLRRHPRSPASDEPDAKESLLFGGLSPRRRPGVLDYSSRDLEVPLVQRRLRSHLPALRRHVRVRFRLNVLGIIRARAEVLYPATLVVRSYFIVCLVAFYWMSRDPMFFVIIGVVVL